MWARALAGIFPGFFLAAAIVGLLCWLPPGPWERTLVPGIIAFFPVWTGVAAAAFAFASARRAWGWLSVLALAGLGLLWALQWLDWVQ